MNRMWKIVAGLVVLMMVASASLGVGVVIGGSGLLPLWEANADDAPDEFAVFWQAGTSCMNFVDRSALDRSR